MLNVTAQTLVKHQVPGKIETSRCCCHTHQCEMDFLQIFCLCRVCNHNLLGQSVFHIHAHTWIIVPNARVIDDSPWFHICIRFVILTSIWNEFAHAHDCGYGMGCDGLHTTAAPTILRFPWCLSSCDCRHACRSSWMSCGSPLGILVASMVMVNAALGSYLSATRYYLTGADAPERRGHIVAFLVIYSYSAVESFAFLLDAMHSNLNFQVSLEIG